MGYNYHYNYYHSSIPYLPKVGVSVNDHLRPSEVGFPSASNACMQAEASMFHQWPDTLQ